MYCSIVAWWHESLLPIDSRLQETYWLRIEKIEYEDFFTMMSSAWEVCWTPRHQSMYDEWYSVLWLSRRDFSLGWHGYRIIVHNTDEVSKTYPLRLQDFSYAVQLLYWIPFCCRYHIQIQESNDERPVGLSFGENSFCPTIIEQSIVKNPSEGNSLVDQFMVNRSNFDQHKYLESSYKLYNSSFRLLDDKVSSYLMLMSSMETLFNENPNQIAHTISRHVSLLVSANKQEFEQNYAEMKKLYKYRNEVIHGIKNPYEIINEIVHKNLMDYLRHCIINALSKNLDKTSLFEYLNAFGFNA